MLAGRGARVTLSESRADVADAGSIGAQGIELELGGHQMPTFLGAQLVVLSPGVSPDLAPIAAARKLYARLNGINRADIRFVETSETSAAQAIALARSLEIDDRVLNPDGGAIARGHPFGAAGAVLVARLFTRMARARSGKAPALGVATVGAAGGLGVAALFEAV